eukprot:6302893-Alexandrium_andersonii.AAC.1
MHRALATARLRSWTVYELYQMVYSHPTMAKYIVQATIEEIGLGEQRRRAQPGALGPGGPDRWGRR